MSSGGLFRSSWWAGFHGVLTFHSLFLTFLSFLIELCGLRWSIWSKLGGWILAVGVNTFFFTKSRVTKYFCHNQLLSFFKQVKNNMWLFSSNENVCWLGRVNLFSSHGSQVWVEIDQNNPLSLGLFGPKLMLHGKL